LTYEFSCQKCELVFDRILTVDERNRPQSCPDCGAPADRNFTPSRVFLSGTKVEHAEYNPGLGCVVKNKRHREEICKRKGLIEVGNDFGSGDKMQAKYDADRAEKRKRSWDEV
jgi:putative FmdB family regulatory protein